MRGILCICHADDFFGDAEGGVALGKKEDVGREGAEALCVADGLNGGADEQVLCLGIFNEYGGLFVDECHGVVVLMILCYIG